MVPGVAIFQYTSASKMTHNGNSGPLGNSEHPNHCQKKNSRLPYPQDNAKQNEKDWN